MLTNRCSRRLDIEPRAKVRGLAKQTLMNWYEDLQQGVSLHHRPTQASRSGPEAKGVDDHIDSASKHFAHESKVKEGSHLPSVRLHSLIVQFLSRIGQQELADRVVGIQRATGPILLLVEDPAWLSGIFLPGGYVGVEMVARGHEDDVR
jgi:hypothetical protein